MKQRDILKALRKMAKTAGVEFVLVRNGANHDIYRLGDLAITMPRHTEVNEMTAKGILKDASDYLNGGK